MTSDYTSDPPLYLLTPPSLKDYVETRTNLSSWTELTASHHTFSTVLSDWLFHSSGSGHKPEFR